MTPQVELRQRGRYALVPTDEEQAQTGQVYDAQYILQNASSVPLQLFSTHVETVDHALSYQVQSAHDVKKIVFEETKKKGYQKNGWVLIIGDLFTMTYLAFEGILAAKPALNTLGTAIASSFFGIIGGIINFLVGIQCIQKSKTFFESKDTLQGWKLLISGILMITISMVMIVTSIAAILAAAGIKFLFFPAIFTFLVANPWVLPVLFFVVALPIIYEITSRVIKMIKKTDCASKMQLQQLEEKLNTYTQYFEEIFNLYQNLDTGEPKEHPPKSIFGKMTFSMKNWWKGFSEYKPKDGAIFNYTLHKEIIELLQNEESTVNRQAIQSKITEILNARIARNELGETIKDTKTAKDTIIYYEDIIEPMGNQSISYDMLRNYLYKLQIEMHIEKLEELQAEIGVKAALDAYKLFNLLLTLKTNTTDYKQTKDQTKEQIETLEQSITEWNRALKWRMFQQMLYVVALPVSIVAATSKGTASLILNATENFAMSAASAIPLYMDIFWPYKTNVPRAIEPSTLEKVQEKFQETLSTQQTQEEQAAS